MNKQDTDRLQAAFPGRDVPAAILAAESGDMSEADRLLGTYGVEYAACPEGDTQAAGIAYCNTGDTYDLTLCRDEDTGAVFAGAWGDWYEQAEHEHEHETDTIRCAYCGEFTPLCEAALAQPPGARHAWRETVCESCGHRADGSNA